MEYKELITRAQQTSIDVPDTDALLDGMRRTLRHRRQRNATLVAVACLLLTITPLTLHFTLSSYHPTPTLAESISATLPSCPDDLPAPLAGYRNSIRNHQTSTVI